MIHVLGIFFFYLVQAVHSAPLPAAGSSLIMNNKKNIFLWPYGLDLNLENSNYEINLSMNDPDQWDKWEIRSKNKNVRIYLRLKVLKPKDDYNKIFKAWLREYEKSGFQIISQQMNPKTAERGWVHLQNETEEQLVQRFIFQSPKWIYLNCLGPKTELQNIKKSCEEVIGKLKVL